MTMVDTLFGLIPSASTGQQWIARDLQVVNWGGYAGPHHLRLAATATLLAGGSGSGKSTLMDAYIALLMPHTTPFNGASNGGVVGRPRGKDQRNVISYARGKLDDSRTEEGTRERVLRGDKADTWTAVSLTWVDQGGAEFTALRAWYVPVGATNLDGLTSVRATLDGPLALARLESAAKAKFSRSELGKLELTCFDTDRDFSARVYSTLGIGAAGGGEKAVALLARIQAGQQITTVHRLYNDMVLEEPGTYAKAAEVVEHFDELAATREQMLTAQQHYYRESFDVIRRHHARFGDIDNVTLWGLHDQRSWRGGQHPLLHFGAAGGVGWPADPLQAFTPKPAFFGAVYSGDLLMTPERAATFERPTLLPWDQVVPVFAGTVALDAAAFEAPYWNQLPARQVAGQRVAWQTRWTPEYLTVLATVHPEWLFETTNDQIEIAYNGGAVRVGRGGIVSGDATAVVTPFGDGYRAIVRIPHSVALGDTAAFDISLVVDGAVAGSFVTTGGTGTLELLEELAFVQVPQAPERPVIDAYRDESWDGAERIYVDTLVSGDAGGATATVDLMWYDDNVDRLFLFIEVTDPDVVIAQGNANADGFVNNAAFGAMYDGIELMFDMSNARAGALRGWYDLVLRITPDGTWARVHGDGNHNNRIIQGDGIAARLTDTGYIIELELFIGVGTGHQLGQWNTALGGIGAVHGLEIRVLDGDGTDNAATHSWATPAANARVNSERWGVFEMVGEADDEEPPVFNADRLGVRRGNRFFKNLELVGGTAEITFTFGREADEVF
ncbi:MAG: endo-1,4-beta-xylanase, partial [Promicromonosporaceae bacterium]|nr:endo-1,4-beta-xylanase [Promicromonosporaceae bacterium]